MYHLIIYAYNAWYSTMLAIVHGCMNKGWKLWPKILPYTCKMISMHPCSFVELLQCIRKLKVYISIAPVYSSKKEKWTVVFSALQMHTMLHR